MWQRIFTISLYLFCTSGLAGASTYTVKQDGTGNFLTIQAAISAPFVVGGDVIVVHPGIYQELVNFLGKQITVRSTAPTDPDVVAVTVIDGSGFDASVVTCTSGETLSSRLEGLTVMGGNASSGGGIYVRFGAMRIAHCVVTGNSASDVGGGVHLRDGDSVLESCTISANSTAGSGGGVYSKDCSPVLTDCELIGNQSTTGAAAGGGGYFGTNCNPNMTGTLFDGNTSQAYGGGIHLTGGDLTLTSCEFRNNGAPESGGAVFAEEAIGGVVAFTDCIFTGNASGDYLGGGAVYLGWHDDVTVTACSFADNHSSHNGGGLYLRDCGAEGLQPRITFCSFAGNTAQSCGGGIYLYQTNALLAYCDFDTCTAGSAGGGYCDDPSCVVTVGGCTFTGNSANVGGGLATYTYGGGIDDCLFTGNSSLTNGGAVYVNGSTGVFGNCRFEQNEAAGNGGGVFHNYAGTAASFYNCLFADNVAAQDGGGFYNWAGDPTLANCTFWGNQAGGAGGGMYEADLVGGATGSNLILWGNSPDAISDPGWETTISFSDVENGWPGGGNIDEIPFFVDAESGNFGLNRYSACDDAGDNSALPPEYTTDLAGNSRHYDDAMVADTGNGGSPLVDMGAFERQANSYRVVAHVPSSHGTIQAAIDACVHGDEIVVSDGTYEENVDLKGRRVWLHSVSGYLSTAIDATNSGGTVVNCAYRENPETVIEGFLITGGSAAQGGGVRCAGTDPTFLNCEIRENLGGQGAGIYCENGLPQFVNCVVDNNLSSTDGGGIYVLWGAPSFVNCTIADNGAAVEGGGLKNEGGWPMLANCVAWNNFPEQIVDSAGTTVATYSDVQGSWPGAGNIDADPLFEAPGSPDYNYRQTASSPVCDAGDNYALPPEILTDILGYERFQDNESVPDTGSGTPPIVDMGAYEWCVPGTGVADLPLPTTLRFAAARGALDRAAFQFYLPERSTIELSVYDLSGRRIGVLERGGVESGWHEYDWRGVSDEGRRQASGFYFGRLSVRSANESRVLTARLLFLR